MITLQFKASEQSLFFGQYGLPFRSAAHGAALAAMALDQASLQRQPLPRWIALQS
ncbi:MAG: hypothetical protein MUE77_05430 [Sandarakinorhabdus sp.]|jgi:hypothetical protein|nr:hypothetical protein [Sandarakinorhabdus sp.]